MTPYSGPKPTALSKKKVPGLAILGSGWLGMALGEFLVQKGYQVNGSTQSTSRFTELQEAGLQPFEIALMEEGVQGDLSSFLEGMDTLLIAVAPGLRKDPTLRYDLRIEQLVKELKDQDTRRVLFISSTSVYGTDIPRENQTHLDERSAVNPQTESGRQLTQAEKILQSASHLETTVLRPGGLLGSDRHPITRLSGKTNLRGGGRPVNLVQRKECIEIIFQCLENQWKDEVINLVHPAHPSKKEYYTQEALKRQLTPPEYLDDHTDGLAVEPTVLLSKGYSFQYPIET